MKAFNTTAMKVHVFNAPISMGKSFNGLSELIEKKFGKHKVDSGDMFLFCNRTNNYIKIMYWHRDGYCIFAKKLPRGTFDFNYKSKALTMSEMSELVDYAVSIKRTNKNDRTDTRSNTYTNGTSTYVNEARP